MEKLAPSAAASQISVGEAEGRLIPAVRSPPPLQSRPSAQPPAAATTGGAPRCKAERPFPSPSFGTSVLQGQFPSDSEVTRGWLPFCW